LLFSSSNRSRGLRGKKANGKFAEQVGEASYKKEEKRDNDRDLEHLQEGGESGEPAGAESYRWGSHDHKLGGETFLGTNAKSRERAGVPKERAKRSVEGVCKRLGKTPKVKGWESVGTRRDKEAEEPKKGLWLRLGGHLK